MSTNRRRNPSVRGSNRQLNRPDRDTSWRHHQMNTLSLSGKHGPTAYSLAYRLPSTELVVPLPSSEPSNWCFDWLSHPEGAYVRHSKSWPWQTGDVVVSLGDVGLEGSDRDAFNQAFVEQWRDRVARDSTGATPVVLSRVLREKPAVDVSPLLWWERFPTADGVDTRWSYASPPPQPASSDCAAKLNDSANEIHPLLEEIASKKWFDAFREDESELLSRDGVLRLLHSSWGEVHGDENDGVIADWFGRFDANDDNGTLTRGQFLAAIKHCCLSHRTSRRHWNFLRDLLHGWGYGSDLRFGTHAAAAAPLIAKATHSMLSATRFDTCLCQGDADDLSHSLSEQLVLNDDGGAAKDQVLGNHNLVEHIASYLHDLTTTACVVYAIGIHESCKNPVQMLRHLEPLQVGTLLDVRRNSTRTNFSPKHLQRACGESKVAYVHYENDVHHDKFDKVGNVAVVRTVEQPCVLLGDELSAESDQEVPPRLADFTARLVEHGVAVVVHLRLTEEGDELLYATHPQSVGVKQYNDRWVPFAGLN